MPSYCCSSSNFLQFTTLFSYSVFFSLFHAPLDDVVHFPVFLRSFRLKSFLSQFSTSVAQIKNVCRDPVVVFSSDGVCQRSHWLFQSLLSLVVIIETRFVSSLLMMVRGANFLPIRAWKVSDTLGSFSFSRSNLSLVCFWLADSFQAKVEGHHQQVRVTSNVCSWKTSCSHNVHS